MFNVSKNVKKNTTLPIIRWETYFCQTVGHSGGRGAKMAFFAGGLGTARYCAFLKIRSISKSRAL